MKTTRLFASDDIEDAAAILRSGGLVAVPTETVYGLAADALNEQAVEDIYKAKGRPEAKPLSVLVTGMEMVTELCQHIPPLAWYLAEAFWPGPLTMVLPSAGVVSQVVTAGGSTLGVRCPDHPVTLSLIEKLGRPLAAPSANLSGHPSPKNARQVLDSLGGSIDAVLDGGPCAVGVESTIVDLTAVPPRILRQGGLSRQQLDPFFQRPPMKLIGITGPTGAGKTTVLKVLESMGVYVIDADAVYHRLTEESQELRQELARHFGDVFDDNGRLDRKKLGARVFHDPAAMELLNRVTHRLVGKEIDRLLLQADRAGKRAAAIDAIALLESGFGKRCDAVIGVLAPRQLRIRRIMAREGISEEYARMRVDAQKENAYFRSHCTHILENTWEDTVDSFSARARVLFQEILNNES